MAVSEVSATDKNAVDALLKSAEKVVRGYTGRTHHPDHAHIGWVLQTTDPSQVSSSVCSPGTEKTDNLGFKIGMGHEDPLPVWFS